MYADLRQGLPGGAADADAFVAGLPLPSIAAAQAEEAARPSKADRLLGMGGELVT